MYLVSYLARVSSGSFGNLGCLKQRGHAVRQLYATCMGRPLDAKIVVVGHQGVGKSSLVLRYVHQQFNANGASTIGASFLAKVELATQNGVN